MSAAFLREPPHHFCLDYHRRTTHRFTEPHRSSSTPHLLHRDRLSSQVRLLSERVNQSFHRLPTRAQPTNPSQLHKTSDKHKK
ncbi:unnamed protein product [Brassica rapa]|uniref:Uncharacterized protein n=1 Tax=Brassica campestris TaxID=3711 RepID=A0A8D9GK39_BRACM|nr:unnamed protein product [Brassica rapa]